MKKLTNRKNKISFIFDRPREDLIILAKDNDKIATLKKISSDPKLLRELIEDSYIIRGYKTRT